MLKVVFLDAEGTFLKFNPSLGKIYAKIWESFGITIEPEEVSQKLRTFFKKVFKEEVSPPLNGVICKEAWREVFKRAFREYRESPFFEEAFKRAYEFFASPECVAVVPGFKEFLAKGRQRGLNFAVISNWDCRLYPILEGHEILPSFDALFLGCEVGYLKPEPEIFKRALEHFKVKPEETIMIGDTFEDDIETSKALGMHTFYIQGEPDYSQIWNFIQPLLFDFQRHSSPQPHSS
jgi:putative hydrolase of the HAD superfamily